MLAPVGSSDHCTVLIVPLVKKKRSKKREYRVGRHVTKEGREAHAQYMAITDWSPVYEAEDFENYYYFFIYFIFILISRQLCKYACHCKGKL